MSRYNSISRIRDSVNCRLYSFCLSVCSLCLVMLWLHRNGFKYIGKYRALKMTTCSVNFEINLFMIFLRQRALSYCWFFPLAFAVVEKIVLVMHHTLASYILLGNITNELDERNKFVSRKCQVLVYFKLKKEATNSFWKKTSLQPQIVVTMK